RPAGLNRIGAGVGLPAGRGLSEGAPGAASRHVVLRGSNLSELFSLGRVPTSGDDVGCREVDVLAAKSFTTLDEDDLLIGVLASGAGFGDPLRRDPLLVRRDVRWGLVSSEMARSVYGVVVTVGEVDDAGTAEARRLIRERRLAEG